MEAAGAGGRRGRPAPCAALSITGGGTPAASGHTPSSVLNTSRASPLTSRIYFCCITHSVFEANRAQRGEALAKRCTADRGGAVLEPRTGSPGPGPGLCPAYDVTAPEAPRRGARGGVQRLRGLLHSPGVPAGHSRTRMRLSGVLCSLLLRKTAADEEAPSSRLRPGPSHLPSKGQPHVQREKEVVSITLSRALEPKYHRPVFPDGETEAWSWDMICPVTGSARG
ncbi:uncharacterized protein LOC118880626 isoform X1 [Balaenoptera musculus]|uniref:Uncharacterized protein LOC118880626 isoform X1 n=1 Tax=Balaenoptera musculus TaxID=9771 RepID=A0A8B8V6H4_BALMU|nr:uncharacterized protein LOC118880626 isoform X1 [Balaenoptera musculus]